METVPHLTEFQVKDIMARLATPQLKAQDLFRRMGGGQVGVYDILDEILHEWIARKSHNATLEELILSLKKCHLNSYADALKQEFTSQLTVKCSRHLTSSNFLHDDRSLISKGCLLSEIDGDNISPITKPTKSVFIKSRRCVLYFIFSVIVWSLFILTAKYFNFFQSNSSCPNDLWQFDNSSASTLPSTSETTTLLLKNITSETYLCSNLKEKKFISVSTYEQFRVNISNLSTCDSISLDVDLSSRDVWSMEPFSIPSDITFDVSISGPFSIGNIIELLKVIPKINSLHLNNSLNKMCQENNNYFSLLAHVPHCYIHLDDLNHLQLSDFVNCEYVFDMILTCVKLEVSIFEFNGNITNANVKHIFHIIQSSRHILKEIKISGIYQSSVSILPTHTKMQSLETLKIIVDQESEGNYYTPLVEKSFCNVFTRINTFVLKGHMVNYQQLKHLQNCTELRELSVSVDVDGSETNNIELLNVTVWYPLLIRLDIGLNFKQCPNVNQSDTLIRNLRQIWRVRVCSNCELSTTRKKHASNNSSKVCLTLNTLSK